MQITELGALEGEIVLFGGPYSNLAALQAIITEAAGRAMICTGDVVAYGADALACVDLMRAAQIPCIAGNCEKQLAANAEDCGCGFDEGSTCDLLSVRWYAHARAQVDATARGWMAGLPDIATFTHAGRRAAVIHGGVTDIARFLWPTSPEAAFVQEIDALTALTGPVDLVVAGHSGLPFQRQIGAVTWLNAGVIGMPPHDGAPQTRYAVLKNGTAEIRHLIYDHVAARSAMRAAGLTQGYDTALQTGWWPSEDILPPAHRRAEQVS